MEEVARLNGRGKRSQRRTLPPGRWCSRALVVLEARSQRMQPAGAVAARSKGELMHWLRASPCKSLNGASPQRTFSAIVTATHQRRVSFCSKRLTGTWRAGGGVKPCAPVSAVLGSAPLQHGQHQRRCSWGHACRKRWPSGALVLARYGRLAGFCRFR